VKDHLGSIRRLVIDLDNGPNHSGKRTQFLKRMIEFADWSGLEVRLVYDPPYPQPIQSDRAVLVELGREMGRIALVIETNYPVRAFVVAFVLGLPCPRFARLPPAPTCAKRLNHPADRPGTGGPLRRL